MIIQKALAVIKVMLPAVVTPVAFKLTINCSCLGLFHLADELSLVPLLVPATDHCHHFIDRLMNAVEDVCLDNYFIGRSPLPWIGNTHFSRTGSELKLSGLNLRRSI